MTNKKVILIGITIILLILFVWWVESDMICTDDGCDEFEILNEQ